VSVVGGELHVANTGAPLDAAGVAALASLRASAKRDDPGSAGRFGVGFAAVLPVSLAPRLVVGPGVGVRFSAADTVAAVAALSGPAAELARREGHVPVLRLVWPVEAAEPGPPEGYATEVRLPPRAGRTPEDLLTDALAAAPDLLLALPDLAEIAVGDETVARTSADGVTTVGGRSYRVVRASVETEGSAAVEERRRRERAVCWALPVSAAGEPRPFAPDAGEVLHAPTPSAERLSLPARLIADLPLDADRRRIRVDAATDAVLDAAATAYVAVVRSVAPEHRLSLVPAPGFPLSPLDGRLRALVLDALGAAAWLPAAAPTDAGPPAEGAEAGPPGGGAADLGASELDAGDAARGPSERARGVPELVPRRAEWLDLPGADGIARLLAGADPAFARLADVDPRHGTVLGELGVRRVGAAELTDRLHAVERDPGWWRELYATLEPAVEAVPGLAEELRALPVPLVDGRLVSGPPSVLLAGPDEEGVRAVAELGLPGLHVVDPAAAHPLLRRLGATDLDPDALLAHPALREAVARSVDDAEAGLDTAPLAAAVLGLVREPVRGLGALALPDAEGVPSRADELVLPDAQVRPLLAGDAPIGVLDPGWAARFPREALVAVGVVDRFAVVVDEDPAGPEHDLHDEDLWWDETEPVRVLAVRDLDLVADDSWPAALALLASARDTRAAVLEPGGHTGWWLARHALLDGEEPGFWRLPSATALAGLYDPAPFGRNRAGGASGPDGPPAAAADEAVLAAIGVRAGLAVTCTDEAADLLERLADPARTVSSALAAAAHEALAEAVAQRRVDVDELEVPDRVRSLAGTVVPVDDAVVLDAPWTAAVLPAGELVVGGEPAALAAILDLPLASEIVRGEVVGTGTAVGWADLPEVVVACRTAGLPLPAGEVWVHDRLEVDLSRPEATRTTVPTWVDTAGRVHAADPVRALLALAVRPGGDG